MKCPHCLVSFHDAPDSIELGEDATSMWTLIRRTCPACRKLILRLNERYDRFQSGGRNHYHRQRVHPAYPKGVSRAPLSSEITEPFSSDYLEACLTLPDSPKASAALSRRCLQHLLHEKAGVKKGNLADEIQAVIDARALPSHLATSLDAVRQIGNFAAHPIKSTRSGEIIEVEAGEAEWNLDVLESLFDFYFVQPAVIKSRKDELNKKLREAGKPEIN